MGSGALSVFLADLEGAGWGPEAGQVGTSKKWWQCCFLPTNPALFRHLKASASHDRRSLFLHGRPGLCRDWPYRGQGWPSFLAAAFR